MEPYGDTTVWFETGPEPILNDPDLATLMVRVGLASNALAAQMQAGSDAGHRAPARRIRDVVCSLVASAAYTNEALKLASEGMVKRRELARRAPSSDEARVRVENLLKRVGKLCAGKHPAGDFLHRARNQAGFHWDEDLVATSVREFGKNQRVVWLESDAESTPIYRLASDVLVHATVPDDSGLTEPAAVRQVIQKTLADVGDAMNIIIEFFTAATYGYMNTIDAERKTKTARTEQRKEE
jgi:hypothetical protein